MGNQDAAWPVERRPKGDHRSASGARPFLGGGRPARAGPARDHHARGAREGERMNDASPTNLVRYDAMCRAIDAAFEVDEVKDIRDKAHRARNLCPAGKERRGGATGFRASRLRAERKVGHLTKQLEKSPGARTDQEPLVQTCKEVGRNVKALEADWRQQRSGPTAGRSWPAFPRINSRQLSAGRTCRLPAASFQAQLSPRATRSISRALWLWGRLQDFERDGLLELYSPIN